MSSINRSKENNPSADDTNPTTITTTKFTTALAPIHNKEVLCSVPVPPGMPLGVEMGAHGKVVDVFPTSFFHRVVHKGDQIVQVNDYSISIMKNVESIQRLFQSLANQPKMITLLKKTTSSISQRSSSGLPTKTAAPTTTKPTTKTKVPPPPANVAAATQHTHKKRPAEHNQTTKPSPSPPCKKTKKATAAPINTQVQKLKTQLTKSKKELTTSKSKLTKAKKDLAHTKKLLRQAQQRESQRQHNLYLPPALHNLPDLDGAPPPEPNERLTIKQALLTAYDLDQSIQHLQKMLPQVDNNQDSALTKRTLQDTIDHLACQRDAIYNLPPPKLYKFEQELLLLVKYKAKHGHCNAPTTKTNGQEGYALSNLVGRERGRYRRFQTEGLVSQSVQELKGIHPKLKTPHEYRLRALMEEDFQLLEIFGFQLVTDKAKWPPFLDMLQRLRDYKQQNGHLKVPQLYETSDGISLGSFVATMRKDYERYQNGKQSPMTPERIQQLESVGMIWKLRFGRPKKGQANFRNRRLGIGYQDDKDNDKDNHQEATTQEFDI